MTTTGTYELILPTMPHEAAPLWVWHNWLCHGAYPDGTRGEECPDGCAGENADPDRIRQMEEAP